MHVWSLPGKSLTAVNIMRTVCTILMLPGSHGEWTGMRKCKQWQLHCASSGGGRHNWVSMCTVWPCIQNDWESRAIFELYLNIAQHKLFRWFRRPQLWATDYDWQLHHDNVPAHAEFFGKASSHPGDSAPPYSPDLVSCNFWLFPKLKSPLKGKRFQTIGEIQEDMMRQLMGIRRTVWGSKVPTLKGTESSLSCV